MLIPVTFTHADSPPPRSTPLPLRSSLRRRPPLPCLPFSAVQSGLGPQMGSNHRADGFRWQASKEAEKVEAALAQDETGSDCSGLQMEISRALALFQEWREGAEENYATTHVNTADEREWRVSTWGQNVIPGL